MNLNLTLLGQMITFAVFIWFTMKFVWPPIMKAIRQRQKEIADGLAAAERGKKELELAKHRSVETIRDAKLKASQLIDQAHARALQIVEEAKETARHDVEHMLQHGKEEVTQMMETARDHIREEVSTLAVTGAEKIMEKDVDQKTHDKMLNHLLEGLS